MEQYNFFGFEVELDKAATQNWYARANEWGCTCGHCRNFLALAQKRNLPDAVLAPLQMLGIPPEKATYVCQLYPDGDGQCYQFSYRIVGRILSEREAEELPYNWVMADAATNPILMEPLVFRSRILIWSFI